MQSKKMITMSIVTVWDSRTEIRMFSKLCQRTEIRMGVENQAQEEIGSLNIWEECKRR